MKTGRLGIVLLMWLVVGTVRAEEWQDDFSNAEKSNAQWVGDWARFAINKNGQLQSQVSEAAESALFHTSTCAINAQWQCWMRISGACSAYNQIRFYIALTSEDTHSDGYYVQIGGVNKNVTLYDQKNGTSTLLIEHPDRIKSLDGSASYLNVRVTRDKDGMFRLFSWIEGRDTTWVEEGAVFMSMVESAYSALYVRNSKTRGYDFYIDNVYVRGDEQQEMIDTETAREKASVELSSENLSPNHDGWEDELCLQYVVPNDDYLATCAVYTANGVLVKQLCHHSSISSSGKICWDGTTASGSTAEIGVYVIYIELRNKSTHDTLRQRMAVSLTL